MEVARHLTLLEETGRTLAEAAAAAGVGTPVPTCEGWSVGDLLRHLGGVHRWATSFVTTGRAGPTSAAEDSSFFLPVPDEEVLGWFEEGHADLVGSLRLAEPSLACWSFLPAPSPLAFWARRQAHETAVHSVDALAAAGRSASFPADFAADGIDELLGGFLARRRGRLVADPPLSVGFSTTDTGDGWTIRIEPDRRVVTSGVGEVDCRLSGPASDLYLLAWNRARPTPAVVLEGDGRALELWRELAAVRWS